MDSDSEAWSDCDSFAPRQPQHQHDGTKWFDINWSERDDYHDPNEYYPFDMDDDYSDTWIPKSKLGESRWSADQIIARGEGLLNTTNSSWDFATLYQRLADLDEVLVHIKDDWPQKRVGIGGESFAVSVIPNDEEGFHVDLAKRLQRQHNVIRNIVQVQSRPYVKNRQFQDLSHDIIHQIVDYCQIMPSRFSEGEYSGRNLIKSFRLTCKLLNEMASPLLMDHVTISITTESLQRLEHISKHPLLSKGVKEVRIGLGYYDSSFKDPHCFAYPSVFLVQSLLQNDTRHASERFREVAEMVRRWHTLIRDNWHDRDQWNAVMAQQPFLLEFHRAYVDKVEDYERALEADGGFVDRVADAMARMPQCKSLQLFDHNPNPIPPKYRFDQTLGHQAMLDQLTGPMLWNFPAVWPVRQASPDADFPPVYILSEIFQALGARGTRLRAVDIQITAPESLHPLEINHDRARQDFSNCVRDVRSLTLKIRRPKTTGYTADYYEWDEEDPRWPSREPDELSIMDSFLDLLLSTESLAYLKLDFQCFREEFEGTQDNWYLPSLLKMETRKWPSERTTYLKHVCLDSSKLGSFLADGSIDLHGAYMAKGTWTEALDIMRQRHKPRSAEDSPQTAEEQSKRFSANVVEVRGAEAETMYNTAHEEWRMAFTNAFRGLGYDPWELEMEDHPDPPPDSEWRARRYASHEREENPCRAFV